MTWRHGAMIVFLAALLTGVWWALGRRADAGGPDAAEVAYGQVAALGQQVRALEAQAGLLAQEVAAQSNRADRAEGLLAEESGTHEPLRRQIEKDLQKEIALKAELDGSRTALAQQGEAARKAAADLAALGAEKAALAGKVATQEAGLKAAAETEATLRRQGTELEAQRAAVAARLAAAEAGQAELKRQIAALDQARQATEAALDAERKTVAQFRAEVETLRKQVQELKAISAAGP